MTPDELGLDPRAPWTSGLEAAWTPGEAGARKRLRTALAETIEGYEAARDLPGRDATSRLSPHLHFGEMSVAEAWRKVRDAEASSPGAAAFLRELGWREFGIHLLHHEPQTADEPLDPRFALFPWRIDRAGFRAWSRGRTGYPIVDAGMRQLWATGWMHNRVRMVVASFLVKHLLLPWQAGARWFWDTLVDADLASNTMNWQWTAGCGADAAPYFRIFNPVLQGTKFDAAGDYVRQWVPELAALPPKWIHRPWEAASPLLRGAQLEPDADYPEPVVDHAAARERALAAFASIRGR
jgi:deoxyribodipyrimidine photo-lyase